MTAAAPPPAFTLDRSQLGDNLATWRARSPRTAAAVCTPDAKAPQVTVCRTDDAKLGGQYRVRAPSYVFVSGRLARIAFTTSIDGFAYAAAVVKTAYGPPSDVRRDEVKLGAGEMQRVVQTWKGPRSTVRLVDPAARPDELKVEVTLDAEAPSLPG